MITATEIKSGLIEVVIQVNAYGDAGAHWKEALGGKNHGGYGKIYIERYGAKERRKDNLWVLKPFYRGAGIHINLDEAPGAMFIHSTDKEVSVEPLCAVSNQKLGRDLGNALRKFKQNSPQELWQVIFRFV